MTIAFVADAPSDAAEPRARPFAAVETHDHFEGARTAWLELEKVAGGAYQTLAFSSAWSETVGARTKPMIVVARDEAGRPVALLPLHRRRFGPMTVARIIGGAWANYQFGLFLPGLAWSADDVRSLLEAAAKRCRVDLFAFSHQPLQWEGVANPLALLPGRPSPNAAFATSLQGSWETWRDARYSRATQKKMRKKARKLEALGMVRHRRAETAAEAETFLEALLSHRAALAKAREEPNPFAKSSVVEMLRRLALAPSPALELHALVAGERIAAVFGAMPAGRRLSGLVISYDGDPEIAVASPGEWLLGEVARDAMARDFATLDLGVGASRYKGAVCEIEEALIDTSVGVTALGRLAAPIFLSWRRAAGEIKRRPQLLRVAKHFRQFVDE